MEPFAGSLATLLARPHEPRVETVNDKDCLIANFWRALRDDPERVARYADGQVNEADMHARHRWLTRREAFRERMKTDPHHFDAKVAGWWVWGICQWIGGGWCASAGLSRVRLNENVGVNRKRLNLKRGGIGVHRTERITARHRTERRRPFLAQTGQGVHAPRLRTAADRTSKLLEYFHELADRLRNVRICCGEWDRVLGPSPTVSIGTTAVLLDPPYKRHLRDNGIYTEDDAGVADRAFEWAVKHGHDPRLRIALCGLVGEHDMPPGWEAVRWKASGGYGNLNMAGRGRANSLREVIWFSPHCLRPETQEELAL